MALWLVRAGRHGEREDMLLEQGLAAIGWSDLPDLSAVRSRDGVMDLMKKARPDEKANTLGNWTGQVWAFRERIKVGDLVVLPLKGRAMIAVGRVKGPYQYRPDLPEGANHTRAVDWLKADLPRTAFDQDILYSLGSLMTVCQIQRNKAEQRVEAVLAGKVKSAEDVETTETEIADIEEYARDQIRDYISRRFRGHDLARLTDEILRAQGYYTYRAQPGADGGADIIAGRGPMGFDPPCLCVQVKSTDSPVDVGVLRELQGTMKNFGAEQGLLVSWGGFKSTVLAEARRLFFEIRLWDSDNLIKALMEDYENLSGDVQAEIPLKKVWTLVLEE